MTELKPLPRTLLVELGKVTTIWAHIEQNMILHASAMAAQHTNGKPIEYLRMDFKRLREKWFSLCRAAFPPVVMNRTVNVLNSNLAKLSTERGHWIHGTWTPIARGRYELSFWEQKATLLQIKGELSLSQVRRFVAACERTERQFYGFSIGEHGFKHHDATVSKITASLVPRNKS